MKLGYLILKITTLSKIESIFLLKRFCYSGGRRDIRLGKFKATNCFQLLEIWTAT